MLEQRLNLKMQTKLMMTPQLQQAIKLLQYQKLELEEVLTQEVVENPLLEEGELLDEPAAPETETKEVETEVGENALEDIDFDAYFNDYLDASYQPRNNDVRELPSFESTLVKTVTLADHLLRQLSEVPGAERIKDIARAIIGNINDDGYLVATNEEIQAMDDYTEAENRRGHQAGAVVGSHRYCCA